jgi:hypothetical protein
MGGDESEETKPTRKQQDVLSCARKGGYEIDDVLQNKANLKTYAWLGLRRITESGMQNKPNWL